MRAGSCQRSPRDGGPAPAAEPPVVRAGTRHTQQVARHGRAPAPAGLALVLASLTGCVAPDVEVVGALGLTVDERQQPVVVVEACDGAATEVELFFDREGLSDHQANEQVAAWSADPPVPGTSELVLDAPAAPWAGEPVEVAVDRGYLASATGEGDAEVLSQVAFRGEDFAEMEPGTVYANSPDPDASALVGRSAEDFTAEVCGRE